MRPNDLEAIHYKLLTYFYECRKNGVIPSVHQTKMLCEVNDTYLASMFRELIDLGYVDGVEVDSYIDGTTDISYKAPRITFDGVDFLGSNSATARAKELLENIYMVAIEAAVRRLVELQARGF